jgi:hypothetical protein
MFTFSPATAAATFDVNPTESGNMAVISIPVRTENSADDRRGAVVFSANFFLMIRVLFAAFFFTDFFAAFFFAVLAMAVVSPCMNVLTAVRSGHLLLSSLPFLLYYIQHGMASFNMFERSRSPARTMILPMEGGISSLLAETSVVPFHQLCK